MRRPNRVHRNTAARCGFTLIELLVVISIIATLMSLILPAVQNARSAARRTQCLNRIRQVGFAVLRVTERQNGQFPSAGQFRRIPPASTACPPGTPEEFTLWRYGGAAGINWVVECLPELDRQDIYDRWQRDPPPTSTVNIPLAQVHLPILSCPDDDSATSGGRFSFVINMGYGDLEQFATRKARLSAGSPLRWVDLHTPDVIRFDWNEDGRRCGQENCTPCDWFDQNDADLTRVTGICWPSLSGDNQSIRTRDLYDGGDNTILISENVNAGSSGVFSDPDPANCGFIYPVEYTTALGQNFPNPPNPVGSTGRPNSERHLGEGTPTPSSYHPGIVNACMASGAARSISDSIDATVYAHMITPRGTSLRSIRGVTCGGVVTGHNFRPQSPLSQDF